MNKLWSSQEKDSYDLIYNKDGATLGYSKNSGVEIIEKDGYAFKNLSKSGKLEIYEDWRLPIEVRAKDLASKLSIEEIAGLMLYSAHQMMPNRKKDKKGKWQATYNGESFDESGVSPDTLSDQQLKFLKEDNLRHVLVVKVQDVKTAVRWNNKVQEYAESIGMGIPSNNSSDPRHGTVNDAEYNEGAGGEISKWPEGIGMAATFDPNINLQFATIASKEYRAMGITTALSPQIDLATEPRWMRFSGTFGENTKLATDMAKTYCEGMQSSSDDLYYGWGCESVNAMVKHWPGGGCGEGGRDGHYSYGKYAVYPGNNFNEHMKPFINGAFNLDGKTKMASAVMPYYTISYDQDSKNGENVGNSFNKYIIHDLLREEHGYDGVVCTDWGITADHGPTVHNFSGKCWGIEEETVAERHLKIILAGVDQFGGNNDAKPIIEAYEIGCERYGMDFMRTRFEQSAVRLLKNIFRIGLFENPYLDEKNSEEIVGCPEFMEAGYNAQLKSITLLKNRNNLLPLKRKRKVYIPNRHINPYQNFIGKLTEPEDIVPVNRTLVEKYFDVVEKAEDADLAIVFMESPHSDGYKSWDLDEGGNGYFPINLQYRPYTAIDARKVSIAGGDPLENFTNRSYYGKTNTTANEGDLDNVIKMREVMGDKPVVVSLKMKNPTVMSEFEKYADAIIVDYGVQTQAIFDIMVGNAEPSGLLPLQIPSSMKTVEEQCEDVGLDMECHIDEFAHVYDFGYGMNFNGVICDERVKKYKC